MKRVFLAAGLFTSALLLAGCQSESGTAQYSQDMSKEMSKEAPKSKSSEPDMPPPPGIVIGGNREGAKGEAPTPQGKG